MLKGKNILVTGVSKGLGIEIVKSILNEQGFVYGISRCSTPMLDEIIRQYPEQFKWISYDLTDMENVHKEIYKKFIGTNTVLDGFVNNAALAYDDIISNLNIERLEQMYKVNVFTPMVMTKYTIRNMLLHNTKGSVIHISSISVHTGYKGLAMYASTKGALEAFSKNTAREWGERGIRSNCLVAGFMETEMSSTLGTEQKNKIYQRTALKQPTSLKSVAETISFLLSEKASSVTGQNVHVDSGTI